MATQRPAVPRQMKRRLVREAGGKCANPGCSATRTELHHIQEWQVYQTHDERHMIAMCPNCHDAVHHGTLEITDDTLYRWKRIYREPATRGHMYVEPRHNPTIELGTNRIFGPPDGFFAFDLSPRNRWKIRIIESEILLLSFKLCTLSGREILRVHDNHWKRDDSDLVSFNQRPGHIRITSEAASEFLPDWVRDAIREVEADYAGDEEILLLDIEVTEPGVVRVQGLWVDDYTAVVATHTGLFFTGNSNTVETVGAATVRQCEINLRENGVLSPTIFRVEFPDRDPKRFRVKMGYP